MKRAYNGAQIRQDALNKRQTQRVIDAYHKKKLLLECWEEMPDELQIKQHAYIIELKARIRALKQRILHRSYPEAKV